MQGKTHRTGGMTAALGGYVALGANQLLLGDVNPILQFTVIYPFAIYGSTASDLDHHWGSSPQKDIISRVFNITLHAGTKIRRTLPERSMASKVLWFFDAKHRSWQTHSYETLALLIWLCVSSVSGSFSSFNHTEQSIFGLVMAGLSLGLIAHIVLDGITPEGINIATFVILNHIKGTKVLPEKVRIVPQKHYFATGGPWEDLVYNVLRVTNVILLILAVYVTQPYRIVINGVRFL